MASLWYMLNYSFVSGTFCEKIGESDYKSNTMRCADEGKIQLAFEVVPTQQLPWKLQFKQH